MGIEGIEYDDHKWTGEMKRILTACVVVPLLVLVSWLSPPTTMTAAEVSTYYVSYDGLDSRSKDEAINPETPWRTIGKALSEASANDVIKVMDDDDEETNDYIENVHIDKSITIERYNRVGPNPQVKSATTLDVFVVTANNVIIRGLDIYGATDQASIATSI